MEKIKFIADTASDIPDSDLARYNIDLPSVPIVVDGKEYVERKSFGIEEFYDVLAGSTEIPVTSRVPADDFLDCYKTAYGEGYTDVICVTINAAASGTNASAIMARDLLYQSIPEAKEKMQIHIVDSRTYSTAYGMPVVEGAKMAEQGKTVAEILTYLDEYFRSVEIYLGCYSLEYAKKSGRIGAAAAFVGDVLGLRPIILMVDGTTKTVDKVRGEKHLIDRIISMCKNPDIDMSKDVFAIHAAEKQYGAEMQQKLKKEFGIDVPVYSAGASIVINAGPKIVAVVVRNKKLRPVPKESL